MKTKKSKIKERVPTGITNFDKLIKGGFEKNSTNLVVGGAGSGKTIFAAEFLVGGMKRGEKCLYITFEEKKPEFYQNMLEVGINLAEYEKNGLLVFLEYSPLKVKTMLEEGGGIIETIVLEKKISRIVIDSITSFSLLFKDKLSQREASLSLFNMISKWNATSLLTLEEDPLIRQENISKDLEFETDSIVVFYYVRNKNERQRYIEVKKMRGTRHSKKIYNFEITEKGITIGKKPASNIPKEIL
mgnify:CR=1 FL=1